MRSWYPVVLLLFVASVVIAVESERDPKESAEAEKAAKLRSAAIAAELKTLGNHPWAGKYYLGDGLGVNVSLNIAPQSGYVFEWHGCLGLYDRNYGSVEENEGQIRLEFTFPNERHGFQGIAPEFIPVLWGPRHYLIPTDDVVGFCNAVNRGSEPRKGLHGHYALREGDEKKPVKGFPAVPEKYQVYLLAKSIEAEIVSVGKYTTRPSITDFKFVDIPVTLNKGTDSGLRVGMELVVTKPKDLVESVKITKESLDRCEAIMTQTDDDLREPKAGWKLSTRAPWQ